MKQFLNKTRGCRLILILGSCRKISISIRSINLNNIPF